MMKKSIFTLAMLAAVFGFSSCSKDEEVNGGQNNDTANKEMALAKSEIASRLSRAGLLETPPTVTPVINKESYHWDNAVDIINTFPEFKTPEGVYHNFVYYSTGEPFDIVMLYSNGGYRHKCGIYWYDENGDCHEQLFWNELDETSKTWYNANGSDSKILSRKSDEAGAYKVQLPKGTKFSFYQESYKATENGWELVTEGVRLDPPAGPVVPCPYKFYTEYAKNWNYQFTKQGQAMTTVINGWTIVGFEDISLTWPSCDKDFNDCVFAINPAQPTEPDPEPEIVEGSVETNLSVSEENNTAKVKLSVHVRAVTDVEIIIPVVDEVLADDFAIVAKHDIEYAYAQELNINGNIVKLNYSLTPENYLKITTSGINDEVIQYCKQTYADGLTFECNLFYGKFDPKATPSITFTKSPVFYITSCVTNSPEATDSEIKWLDTKAANIEALNFESTGGEFIYDHKVYSLYTTDELKEKGMMK